MTTKRPYRYELLTTPSTFHLPPGAEVLSVATHKNVVCLWVIVDTDAETKEPRTFYLIGTGDTMPDGELRFIGTAIHKGFVFHVFEAV